MPPPGPLTDIELEECGEAELLARLVACRDAGMGREATRATWFLLALAADDIEVKLGVKLPRDVASEQVVVVMERLLRQAFRGSTRGEFHGLLTKVINGVRVDWLRKHGEQLRADRAVRTDEDGNPPERGEEDPGFEVAEYGAIMEDVLASRSPEHRQAIELFRFHDLPARRVAEQLGMTEGNVNQINRRFVADCERAAAS